MFTVYGWRSADVTNIQNMKRGRCMRSVTLAYTHPMDTDFPRTQQIYLEQNYRSTSSILDISHAIIAQGTFASSRFDSLGGTEIE